MRRGLTVLLLSLALTACGGSNDDQSSAAPPPTQAADQLTDLENVLDLRGAFNENDGAPRLILVLSPT